MRVLKVLMLIVVVVLIASIYFYINDNLTGNKDNNDNQTHIDKTINKEYKTLQDDKDSVVESNKVLLLKVSRLEKNIKNIKDAQNQQAIKLGSVTNNNTDLSTNDIVDKVVALVNKGLPKLDIKDNNTDVYKINNTGNYNNTADNNSDNNSNNYNPNSHNHNQSYIWTQAMHSGVIDKDGNYVNIQSQSLGASSSLSPSPYSSQLINSNPSIHSNPFANSNQYSNTNNKQNIDVVGIGNSIKDNNPSNNKDTAVPAYTIPNNSVLSATLTSGLVGRIPVDRQVTDPFRFNVKITDKSFYAGGHANNVLRDVFASGTASGDLLLSCVRAGIDSITYIFADGTISDHKISDIGYLANEFGYPCIKGELITNVAQYLGTSALFSGLSGGAKAFAQAQKTTTSNSDGSTSSSITGSPYRLLGASVLSSGAQDMQKWVNSRADSSFDVVFVPSGKSVQILTQQQINIDYNPKGRKLNHQLSLSEPDNGTYQLD